MKATAETFTQKTTDQRLVDLKVTISHIWIRLCVVYGVPPGSHMGLWRTRWGGLHGINLRIGKRHMKALTMFVHWKIAP